jgi:MOSC domain-containing protein YiiM
MENLIIFGESQKKMHIVSVNTGEPRTIRWKGADVVTGIFKYPVESSLFLGETGVTGDHVIDIRFHGGKDKACYLYSEDHYRYWKSLYPDADWDWGMFGENLTVENLDESQILIGDIFRIGGALVQISQPRQPCYKLGIRIGNPDIVKQFSLSDFPGAYIRILEEGYVQKGDFLSSVETFPESPSLKTVFHMLYHNSFEKEEIRRVTENIHLAASCRNDLIKKWGL